MANHSFFAYKTTGQGPQTIVSSATNLVTFGATTFNNGGSYSTTTSKFTAPEDGTYLFHVKVAAQPATDTIGDSVFFTVNDNFTTNQYYSTSQPASNFGTISMTYTVILYLSEDDLVDVYYQNNSAFINDACVFASPNTGFFPTVFMGYMLT